MREDTLQSLHACLYRSRSGVMRRDVGHTPKMEVFVFGVGFFGEFP